MVNSYLGLEQMGQLGWGRYTPMSTYGLRVVMLTHLEVNLLAHDPSKVLLTILYSIWKHLGYSHSVYEIKIDVRR